MVGIVDTVRVDMLDKIRNLIGGHSLKWALYHELWHYIFSLSFSLVLLLAVHFLSSGTYWLTNLVSERTFLIVIFLLSVSLGLVWHYILDISSVAKKLRFWWWELQ